MPTNFREMDILAAWSVPSASSAVNYEVLLHHDGERTCNCPGWIIKRNGKPRSCRHVKQVRSEAEAIFADFQRTGVAPRPTQEAASLVYTQTVAVQQTPGRAKRAIRVR